MIGRVILTVTALLLLGPVFLPGRAAVGSDSGSTFFTNQTLHRFDVELTRECMASLRLNPRVYVPATVHVNGRLYTNVGVHLKGVATFRPVDDQPSLTLNFRKFAKRQSFHGLRKIHLNNGKEDPTFLCEAISAELFARAGLPVARVTLAEMRLNGRKLGPYVAIEGFTEEFLGRHFHDTTGNLYDSGFRRDITAPLEKLQGTKADDWSDLKRLAVAASTPELAQRWEALSRYLDTNHFARYLAMQVLTANWDGYALFQNNYRVYHDPESDRLFFIPHGMDQMFSRFNFPLMPPRWSGLVARAFMETPAGRQLYQQQVATLFTNVYHGAVIVRQIDELAARVRPIIAEQDEVAANDYDRRVTELRSRILLRGEFLKQQLKAVNWMDAPRRR